MTKYRNSVSAPKTRSEELLDAEYVSRAEQIVDGFISKLPRKDIPPPSKREVLIEIAKGALTLGIPLSIIVSFMLKRNLLYTGGRRPVKPRQLPDAYRTVVRGRRGSSGQRFDVLERRR